MALKNNEFAPQQWVNSWKYWGFFFVVLKEPMLKKKLNSN